MHRARRKQRCYPASDLPTPTEHRAITRRNLLCRRKMWPTLTQIIHWKLLTRVLQMPLLFITEIFKRASEGHVNFKFHSEQQLALPNT